VFEEVVGMDGPMCVCCCSGCNGRSACMHGSTF